MTGVQTCALPIYNPASLAPFGLDKPHRVFIQAGDSSLNLLVGRAPEGSSNRLYAKLDTEPGVFTIDDASPALRALPFGLIDKFALIVGIDRIDTVTVAAGGKTFTGRVERTKETVTSKDADGRETSKEETRETYYFNGKKAEEKSFKDFYQACIGLVADAENPAPSRKAAAADIVIEYRLAGPAGQKTEVRLVPYNRDFYAVHRDGSADILVSRVQAGKIAEAADKVKLTD